MDYKITEEQSDIIDDYCKNEMKKLKTICHSIWGKKNIANSYHDDLYSDALKVLMESVITFDPNGKANFKTYLTSNIQKSYYEWYRDTFLRAKRNNLEKDENGNIKRDENGNPSIIKNVSMDAPTENGLDLKDIIPDENGLYENEEFSPRMKEYLSRLSNKQKEVLYLLSIGFIKSEIIDRFPIFKEDQYD